MSIPGNVVWFQEYTWRSSLDSGVYLEILAGFRFIPGDLIWIQEYTWRYSLDLAVNMDI